MPICEKNKLAFCHVPRTGGVSICNGLNLKIIDRHFPASWYRKNYPDYFLFATHRPYADRIQSAYGYKHPERTQSGVEKGLNNVGLMLKPDEYFIDTTVDFLLRFSHLNEDLNTMLKQRGIREVNLIKCNSFR